MRIYIINFFIILYIAVAIFVVVALIALCPVVHSEEPWSVLVLPFHDTSADENYEEFQQHIPDLLEMHFSSTDNFVVVNRANLKQVLAEQKLNLLDGITKEESLQLGNILAARQIVSGGYIIQNNTIIINAKISDGETSRVISHEKVQGKLDHFGKLIHKLFKRIMKSQKDPLGLIDHDAVDNSPIANLNFMKGLNYYFSANYNHAIGEFVEASKEEKVRDLAQFWLANCYLEKKEYGHAYMELKKIHSANGMILKDADIKINIKKCLKHLSEQEVKMLDQMVK